MGYARNRPKLLPNKLRLIRELLGMVRMELASKLEVTSRRLSNLETGRGEPTMIDVLVYARLAEVPMELIIDDLFSVDAFRCRLLRKQKRRTSSDKTE
jgi:transcriptional regulator with XRE-family HTH domain